MTRESGGNYFARNIVSACDNFFLGENEGKQLDVDDIDGDIQECSEPLALPFAGLQLASTQAAYFEEVFNTVVSTL